MVMYSLTDEGAATLAAFTGTAGVPARA
jgi:hypothetical protein